MATVIYEASKLSRCDVSVHLHTIVNVAMGGVDGKVVLAAFTSLDALLELNEMSMDAFHQALKADELSEVMVLRPELELSSSSLIDEAVFEETKVALNARSGSST